MNLVILHGRLARDPEFAISAGTNKGVCKFTVGVNKAKDAVDWFDLVAFEATADGIYRNFKKGDGIIIQGRLSKNNWQTQTGEKRSSFNVLVDRYEFPNGKANHENKATEQANAEPQLNVTDDMLPF